MLEQVIHRLIPSPVAAALEVGCGCGFFLPILDRYADTVVGVDGHTNSLREAHNHLASSTLVHSDVARLPLADDVFNFACALDVLEHVEPLPFLREIHRTLKPGGHLLLSVPAFPLLWSSVDEKAGHRCRYRLSKAHEELAASGFRVLGFTHYQFLLFPLVWLTRKVATNNGRRATESRPPALVNRLLGQINHIEASILSGYSLPFGSSLIVWSEAI